MYVSISGSDDQLVGQSYSLTCQVNGAVRTVLVNEYEWFMDGSPLAGEISKKFSFSSLADTDSGDYTCRVTVGDQTSTSASLTITPIVLGK